MRIDRALLKKVWKQIEVLAASSQPAAAPKNTPKTPDTFAPAAPKQTRHYSEIQQSLRELPAPRFDRETATKIVENLYRGVLGREVDPLGRETWIPLVEQGRLSNVIDSVVGSHEFKTIRSQQADPRQLSKDLYTGILGREADPEGGAATYAAINRGQLAQRLFDMILSPEHAERLKAKPAPVEPTPTPTIPAPAPNLPKEPGAPLQTVPMRPEYNIPIDRSSEAAAAKSAATWVRQNKPEFFDKGDDRAVAFEMMTWVIGILRANGFDANRVVNHPSFPVGAGMRYGSDAVVMPSQAIYDVFVAWGDPGRGDPVANNVGPYAPGRLRE